MGCGLVNGWTAVDPALAMTAAVADRPATMFDRIHRSFIASVGSIVFGMEDGTVSIFGLVFGVAFSAPNSHAVLLAGGTGAVAAAVSMMAGTFLDVESTNDQAAAWLAEEKARFDANPSQEDQAIHGSERSPTGHQAAEATAFRPCPRLVPCSRRYGYRLPLRIREIRSPWRGPRLASVNADQRWDLRRPARGRYRLRRPGQDRPRHG
jgi:VIT family